MDEATKNDPELVATEPAHLIVTGGTGKRYLLDTGVNMVCRLEELRGPGVSYSELLDELRGPKPRVSLIRDYFKAALVAPELDSIEAIGSAVDDIGGWPVLLMALASDHPEAVIAQLRSENAQLRDELAQAKTRSSAKPDAAGSRRRRNR